MTSNFLATSKDRYQEIFSNKTKVPCVGTYNPVRDKYVFHSSRPQKFLKDHLDEKEAAERKVKLMLE